MVAQNSYESTDSRLDAAHKTGLEFASSCELGTNYTRAVSYQDTLDDRVQGLDAGADDYLVKPFELRVISTSPRPCVVQVLATDTNQRLKVADLERFTIIS